MAKVNRTTPLSRRDVLRSRRRIHFRRKRGGDVYASSWPPLRGKKKTPLQKEWVDNFKFLAAAPKIADGCALAMATDQAKDTGYFWRDVVSSALSGKLLHYIGSVESAPPLPFLYREQVTKFYEGVPRVTTPAAGVTRVTNQNLGNNTWDSISWTAQTYNNNRWWSLTPNPTRLTAITSGLYMFGAWALVLSNFSGYGICRWRKNGSTVLVEGGENINTGGDRRLSLVWVDYLNAGDYVEFQCLANSAGRFVNPAGAWIVGITPEAVI